MRHMGISICLGVLAFPLFAQGVQHVAYPQNSTLTGAITPLPMGYNKSSPDADEARSQQLIPRRFLPSTGATINAIGFVNSGDGPVTYKWLRLRLSHLTADALARDFATNLPNPVVLLDRQDFQIPWRRWEWHVIPLAAPVVYDGSSNLVLDFQKVLDSTKQSGNGSFHLLSFDASALVGGAISHRTDLPIAWEAFGRLGSGASNAPRGQQYGLTVVKVRLCVDVPTLTLRSDPFGTRHRIFAPGGMMHVSNHAPPGTVYGNLVDVAFGSPLQFPNILGASWLWLPNALVLNGGTIPASGTTTLSLRIPNDPGLIRDHFVLQGVTASPMLTNLRWTNATDFYVNPLN